jgi:hypothetical protein
MSMSVTGSSSLRGESRCHAGRAGWGRDPMILPSSTSTEPMGMPLAARLFYLLNRCLKKNIQAMFL